MRLTLCGNFNRKERKELREGRKEFFHAPDSYRDYRFKQTYADYLLKKSIKSALICNPSDSELTQNENTLYYTHSSNCKLRPRLKTTTENRDCKLRLRL